MQVNVEKNSNLIDVLWRLLKLPFFQKTPFLGMMYYLATQNGLTSHCYKLDISNQSVYLWQIYWPKHSTCDKLQDYSQYTQVCGWKVRKILRHSGHKFVDSTTFVSTWGFRFLVFYELCPNQPPLAWKNIIDTIHFILKKILCCLGELIKSCNCKIYTLYCLDTKPSTIQYTNTNIYTS